VGDRARVKVRVRVRVAVASSRTSRINRVDAEARVASSAWAATSVVLTRARVAPVVR
jgi:hypothetical protein